MIYIAKLQQPFIQKVINDFFPEGCKSYYNDYKFVFTIIPANQNKTKNPSKYIDVIYFRPDKCTQQYIQSILLIDDNSYTIYNFVEDGRHFSSRYKTKFDGWYHQGRASDGLNYQEYHPDGSLRYERYTDYKTQAIHNPKGYAEIHCSSDGIITKSYFINGHHLGDNLDVGDDPEAFLQNYMLL